MSYKPDEGTLMAYLYGELEGAEKESVERYLAETPEARLEVEKMGHIRDLLSILRDKEVIAPPLVIEGGRRFSLGVPYIRTILAVAASLVAILVAGKLTGVQVTTSGQELRISFGGQSPQQDLQPLDATEVSELIDARLAQNNAALKKDWKRSQEALDQAIRNNLAENTSRIDMLVKRTSSASEEQISAYVSGLQAENMQMIKEYYKLTSEQQKQYLEELLVDFAKYLQQQRNDDLMVMEARMNDIQQNTDLFRQETEQILSSIISNASLSVVTN